MPRKKAVVEEVVEEVVENVDSPSEEVVEYDPLVYPEYRPITFTIPMSMLAEQLPVERANISAILSAGGYRLADQKVWRDPHPHIDGELILMFLITLVRDH